MTETTLHKRSLKGTVTSDKADKTVTVTVVRLRKHAKYKKYFKSSRKFYAHDEENAYKIGDVVMIQESRPISKNKRWIVIKKLS